MKLKLTYLTIAISSVLLLCGCSTKKNTGYRRFYHAFTTQYNVYFNAKEAYNRGEKKIENAYEPNYSHVINLYAISDKRLSGLAKTDMTTAEEKCMKAIKEHSISKKPKKKAGKTRDPKYMEFYNKEEFNKKMYDVWMLLGKSKFMANDYLAASATFTYIIKHFPENKKLVAEASIWKARSLKEMDWTYEAEGVLDNMDVESFNDKLSCFYSVAYADIKIAKGEKKDAIPYLMSAIELEKNKKMRTRYKFVAAQILQEQGNSKDAYRLYGEVIKSNPDYQLAFNSRIRQTEVYDGQNKEDMIKSLSKMAKKSNNKDFLDQIYYAIGNVYLKSYDTVNAIANYKLSIEKSTRNGLDKVQSLITLGDIYYNKGRYFQAQPCFSEAYSLIDNSYPGYNRISNLSRVLDELAQQNEIVNLQDSILLLSSLSKKEQIDAAKREIAKIETKEAQEYEQRKKQELENQKLDVEIENMAVMDRQAMGGNRKAEWYFYNPRIVSKGKIEFQRKFGNRRLEDNWIRKNKAFVMLDEAVAEQDSNESETTTDSVQNNLKKQNANPKSVDFYLAQIPKNDEQKKNAELQLADALFEMAIIYNEKLNDYKKALETFDEFRKRFPNDPRSADAAYYCFSINNKLQNTIETEKYKNILLSEYPDTKYAQILSHPDYRKKYESMMAIQDSLYEKTYKDYLKGNYSDVIATSEKMEKEYHMSPLIPKFMMLKSLSIGKSGDKDSLQACLTKLVKEYPTNEVSTMAKDILALMKQGLEPKQSQAGGLAEKRDLLLSDTLSERASTNNGFVYNEKSNYFYYIITDPAEVKENWLLYYVASYNFTKFLVKDFDLHVKNGTLVVSGLDNLDEALWYAKGIDEDNDLKKFLDGKKYTKLVISQENSELIGRGFTIDDYMKFYQDSIINRKKTKSTSANIELIDNSVSKDTEGKIDVKEGDNLMNVNKQTSPKVNNSNESKEQNSKTSKEDKPIKDTKADVAKNKSTIVVDSTSNRLSEKMSDVSKQEQVKKEPKKDLKKYKGLYTYDIEADHKFVILVSKNDVDIQDLMNALNKYNTEKQPLLNLRTSLTSGTGFEKIIEVGLLPNAKIAKSYLLQLTKDDTLREALNKVPHKRIVISEDNLSTLKTSGNLNVYMELFRRLYLGR